MTIVIFVAIAMTAAVLLSSQFQNVIENFNKRDTLTIEDIPSSSIIETKHLSSKNSSFDIISTSSSSTSSTTSSSTSCTGTTSIISTSMDATEDMKNQTTTSIPTINESTIDDGGRYRI